MLAMAGGLTVRADAGTVPPRLVAADDWMRRNGTILTSVIIGVIGLFIIGIGIARL